MKILGRQIGENSPAYVIAEIGINHGGDPKVALALIDAAAEAGVDAVKFQTYLTEKRTKKTSPIFQILKECELPFEVFGALKRHAENRGVHFFSTPFDLESLAFLESIGCPFYKIASFYTDDLALLGAVAKTGKPVIYSTGMTTEEDAKRAYRLLSDKTPDVAALHCVSSYPTADENCHLRAISKLRQILPCVIGQSDHTPGIEAPVYAVACGARILEKHFKVDDAMKCVDSPVSIGREAMREMIRRVRHLERMLGSEDIKVRDVERPLLWIKDRP